MEKQSIYIFIDNMSIGNRCFKTFPIYIWERVHSNLKPPDCIDLDFRILHNRIFTNLKLVKMKLIDSSTCYSCKTEEEDLFHFFLIRVVL